VIARANQLQERVKALTAEIERLQTQIASTDGIAAYFELPLCTLIVTQIRPHRTFPKLPVIWHSDSSDTSTDC
jgi:hypothetical protein